MPSIQKLWDDSNRISVLTLSALSVGLIAVVDWWTKPYVSLGFLYLFPLILMAGFLPRVIIVGVAVGCALLAEGFSSLEPSLIRLGFEALALAGCGLFVAELIGNRKLKAVGQARLEALVETSPAGIVTIDDKGLIEIANEAAVQLLAPRGGNLVGTPIAAFLPELHHAIRWEEAPQFRASMQCPGHRGDGKTFMADIWFSTYNEGSAPKVAAIITEVPEENGNGETVVIGDKSESDRISLNDREIDVLRLLVQGLANKEIAARLDVSESTTKNVLQQLFAKTGVRTRAQLVRIALENYRDVI